MITHNRTYTAHARADLSAAVGKVLKKIGTTNDLEDVAVATDKLISGGEKIVGVCLVGATEDNLVTVLQEGVTEDAIAGGNIPADTVDLTTDGSGLFIVAAAGDQVVAKYRGNRAAVANDRITVYVTLSKWAVA